MKAVIPICMAELIIEKFGGDKWNEILRQNNLDPAKVRFLATQEVEDQTVLDIVSTAARVLGVSPQQFFDAFGDHWVNDYSQKMYAGYYRQAKTAKEFLLKLDWIHSIVTESLPGAKPPRFTYEEPDENTLIIIYDSHRDLIDMVVGCVKGVGRFYGENLDVTKLGPDKVQVRFL